MTSAKLRKPVPLTPWEEERRGRQMTEVSLLEQVARIVEGHTLESGAAPAHCLCGWWSSTRNDGARSEDEWAYHVAGMLVHTMGAPEERLDGCDNDPAIRGHPGPCPYRDRCLAELTRPLPCEGTAVLDGYSGTPAGYVEAVVSVWNPAYGDVRVEPVGVSTSPAIRVTLVTGGWSGNEDVVAQVRRSWFHLLWWESSHRGGMHVYEVPVDAWSSWQIDGALP